MALLHSDVRGVDMVHNARISSVTPLSWVKPLLLLHQDCINVCSMTRSELRSAKYWLLRRIMETPGNLVVYIRVSGLELAHFLEVVVVPSGGKYWQTVQYCTQVHFHKYV